MSTKISSLPARIQADINGEEFFPIVDGTVGAYQTYKIELDQLFASGQGHEKVTSLIITEGKERNTGTNPSNKFFTLEYIDEAGTPQTLRIQKYAIEDNDVAFTHIAPAGYITSTQTISNGNTNADDKLVTSAAVDEHVVYKEDLLFNNSDSAVKEHFGDEVKGIPLNVNNNNQPFTPADAEYLRTGSHVLANFRLNTEVAQDFINLLDGVKSELNTFKKIEEEFDLTTVDRNTKIGTDQVNLKHFRINTEDDTNRLNIKDSGITSGLIDSGAVTNSKIAPLQVTNSKIGQSAVTEDKIGDGAVTTNKIIDEAVTPAKLSGSSATPPLSPSWDNSAVNIPRSLSVTSNINAIGNISQKGTTFSIYNAASRGAGLLHEGRAIVHGSTDNLSINHLGDFTGGVNISGVVTVSDMSRGTIETGPGGEKSVVTKEYVDFADIRIRPLDPSRIGDDAIINRHISDGAVNTLEIADDSITSDKVENIGPQWNSTGDVVVSGKLDVYGQELAVGLSSSTGPALISLTPGGSGSAKISRQTGTAGLLSINNTGGSISLSPGPTDESKILVSSVKTTVSNPVHITAEGSTTIAGSNFDTPPLLIGSSSNGIAIDQNEILQKGNDLHVGVSDGDTQDILFKTGLTTIAKIHGNSGDFRTEGSLITTNGNVKTVGTTNGLLLDGQGAKIELRGETSSGNSSKAIYSAAQHTFKSVNGEFTAIEIDSSTRQVKLFTEGTLSTSLITKNYVDTKKIAPTDLTDFGPQWNTTTVAIPYNLHVNDIATVGGHLSVGGHIHLTGTDFKLYNTTRADGNIHAGRALVHGTGDKLTINYVGDYTGGVEIKGKVIAPDQTAVIINANEQALTTKKYVDAEIGKTFPDDNYIKKTGNINQSMTAALTIAGTVDPGAEVRSGSTYVKNGTNLLLKGSSEGVSGIFFQSEQNGTNINHASDFGYIQYHARGYGNTTGEQSDLVIGVTNDPPGIHTDKVVIDVPHNSNFVLTPNNGITEHQIWHAGNDGSASGLDADKLDGSHASDFAKINTQPSFQTPTASSHAATKAYVDNKISAIPTPNAGISSDTADAKDLAVLKRIYPVGVIYTSVVSTNPGTFFGFGTWQVFGAGRVLVGVNGNDSDFNASKKTGGAKTHTLSVAEMPSHNHRVKGNNRGTNKHQKFAPALYKDDAETFANDLNSIEATGGSQPHNNMPPYITVYMFQRTA